MSVVNIKTVQKQINQNVRHLERTFIMLKPDSVQRGLIGDIIKRFEVKGFKLVGLKIVWVRKKNIYSSQFNRVRKEQNFIISYI